MSRGLGDVYKRQNRDIEASDYKYSRNIWVEATEGYLQDQEDAWYKQPSNVVGVLVNPITGKPATEADEKKKIMYYVKGTEPSSTDTVFDELLEQDEQILEQN